MKEGKDLRDKKIMLILFFAALTIGIGLQLEEIQSAWFDTSYSLRRNYTMATDANVSDFTDLLNGSSIN